MIKAGLSLDGKISSDRVASYEGRAASALRGDVSASIEKLRIEAAADLLVIGRLLRQAAVVERVGRHYCNSVGISPEEYAPVHALPTAPQGCGRAAAAIALLDEALALLPSGVPIRYELAKLWALIDDGQRAISHLRGVVEQLPEFTAARYFLGVALLDAGLSDQAAEEFRVCLRQRPGLADARRRLNAIRRDGGARGTGADELRSFETYGYPDFRGHEPAPVTLKGEPLEISEMGPVQLVQEGYRGYNVVTCGGAYFALAQSLGPVVPDDVRIKIVEARFSSPYRRTCRFLIHQIDKVPYIARSWMADLLSEPLVDLASRMRRLAVPVLHARTREEALAKVDAFLDQENA